MTRKAKVAGWNTFDPVDAYLPSYNPAHDLTIGTVQKHFLDLATDRKLKWIHMGITCTSWSRLRLWTTGTRTAAQPMGVHPDPTELIGNKELRFAMRLSRVMLRKGGYISIENPRTSLMWKTSCVHSLMRDFPELQLIHFDQCCYGLGSPVGSEHKEVWKKATCLLTNLPQAQAIAKFCPGSHTHTAVVGQIKIFGRNCRRSTLAGAYPNALCSAIVSAASPILTTDCSTNRQ